MEKEEKLVIITTIGNEHPEKATIPFVMATAAQATDVKVVVIMQSNSVLLAKKGEAEKVEASGFLPVKQLIDTYIELGGVLLLCSPCLKERNITAEDLIPGTTIIAGGTVIFEVMSATSVMTY
jgi:predicted peroxiredoxin